MDEEMKRFNIFIDTLRTIDSRNADEESRNGGAVHGITRYADLTQSEFESMFLDHTVANKFASMNVTAAQVTPYVGAATAKDHTGSQTTAVKDQGSCGSCWAHAAAEQIESDGMRLLGNAPTPLSVQQLMNCDKGSGQLGCGGGLQEPAFDYVHANGGIVTAADLPYTGKNGVCDKSINHYVVGVTKYDFIITKDNVKQTEADFTSHVLSTGTISIGVDATTWNTYKSGVMSNCGKGTDINHAVQLVGVDTSATTGYWKIRNSWSASWGEAGYIRVSYGKNTCGLATEGGSYTTVFNI